MPTHSSSNLPKRDIHLNRENSLPTYDEAIERVRQDELTVVAPSAPVLPVVPTETQQYYVSNDRPNHHSPNRTPISQVSPRGQDVERVLQNPRMLQHQDPVVRQMAQTVLEECRRAKKKREMKIIMNIVGFIIAMIIILVIIAVKASNRRQ